MDDEGQPDDAERHCKAALSSFRRLGDRQGAAECLLLRASWVPEEQQRLAAQALDLSEQINWDEGISKANRLRSSLDLPARR